FDSVFECCAPYYPWGGGAHYRVALNGKPYPFDVPAVPGGGGIFPVMLRVANQGNLYALTYDKLWYMFGNYQWLGGGDSTDEGADPPASWVPISPPVTPTPPLPMRKPPFTPSPDGTSIQGGTGSLVTADGVWTFGAPSGSGWEIQLNGIPAASGTASELQVNGHAQLFALLPSGWSA